MANKPTTHLIKNVQALYPKINQTYKYDSKAGEKGKTVPCPPSDEGAKYETSFKMTKPQAQDLYAVMEAAYAEAASKQSDWPEALLKPSEVFKKDDKDGMFIGKAVLKGKYGNQFTDPPMQVDSKNTKLPPDFELTTGSRVNFNVVLVPYSMREHGVSLRLKAVQVLELAERKPYSPFDVEDEGFSVDDTGATGFEDVTASADVEPDEVSEEVAEPKKVKKKKAEAAPAPDQDLQGILDDWADDDAA